MEFLFARLVQRFTSYFSALSSVNAVPPTLDAQVLYEEPSSVLSVAPPQPPVVDDFAAPYVESCSLLSADRAEKAQQNEYSPSTVVFPLALPPLDCVPLARSKQRLAGHITKITLQTVTPALTTAPTSVEVHEPVIVRVLQRTVREEQATSPMLNTVSSNEKNTSSHVPIVTLAQRKATRAVQPQLIFGTGSFEYGQSDCQVFNEHVNAASVVIVMLTTNPGPTAVQYVSLQPGLGFSVHLSKPALSEAPFNYVVMSDDNLGGSMHLP
ncbi:MAG: hypothetical protein JO202_02475 [Ktedonobacteraceae bacterium]|nr:hypothetical protein [Ktedonobacteraceae bacterium]